MKKAWTLIILFVFAVGFFMGRAFPGPKEVPDIPETREITVSENLVYISDKSAVCHKDPNCSGMKHYKVMTYGEAEGYFRFCKLCWNVETIEWEN